MHDQIKTFITQEIVQLENPEHFSSDDDLLAAGLDSMGIMRLIMFLEKTFGVTLPDNEIEPDNIQTLNYIVKWVERHQ